MTITTLIYLSVAVFLAFNIYTNSNEYKEYKTENSKILDGEERLTDWKEWLNISDLWDKKTEKSENALEHAEGHYENAVSYSFIFVAVSLIYFLLTFFLFYKTTYLFRFLSLSLISIAFILLAIGISTPMIEIGAFKESLTIPIKGTIPIIDQDFDLSKEFDGRMYFFYQVKSIIDVIGLLVTPLLKLFLSLFLFAKPNHKNKVVDFVVNNLGKWSMADVFVVSIYLAYFSFQNMSTGVDMESNSLLGLYFFLAFVILSIISSMLLKQAAKKHKETVIFN
jgi:Paraquat-inducible protein A